MTRYAVAAGIAIRTISAFVLTRRGLTVAIAALPRMRRVSRPRSMRRPPAITTAVAMAP